MSSPSAVVGEDEDIHETVDLEALGARFRKFETTLKDAVESFEVDISEVEKRLRKQVEISLDDAVGTLELNILEVETNIKEEAEISLKVAVDTLRLNISQVQKSFKKDVNDLLSRLSDVEGCAHDYIVGLQKNFMQLGSELSNVREELKVQGVTKEEIQTNKDWHQTLVTSQGKLKDRLIKGKEAVSSSFSSARTWLIAILGGSLSGFTFFVAFCAFFYGHSPPAGHKIGKTDFISRLFLVALATFVFMCAWIVCFKAVKEIEKDMKSWIATFTGLNQQFQGLMMTPEKRQKELRKYNDKSERYRILKEFYDVVGLYDELHSIHKIGEIEAKEFEELPLKKGFFPITSLKVLLVSMMIFTFISSVMMIMVTISYRKYPALVPIH